MPNWPHQDRAIRFLESHPSAMLAMGMGTGKSKVVVDHLLDTRPSKTLILCPKSVLAVWRREFEKWAPGIFRVLILDRGTCQRKSEVIREHLRDTGEGGCMGVVVINYDSSWRKPLGDLLLKTKWDVTILDESHRCKSHNAAVSRFVMQLGIRPHKKICLTGTPMPHSPLDVFGQYRFLDWRLFGKRWMPFLYSYAVRGNPMIPQQITGYRNLDVLQGRFARLAFQVGREVLDLLPSTHHIRYCDLPDGVQAIYREIEEDFCAMLKEGIVTVSNALVRTLRLRQCVSGFLKPDDAIAATHLHCAKETLLEELLTDLPTREPVVVFCEFRHDLTRVERLVNKIGRRYAEVSGRRSDLTEFGTMPEWCDVMGVQYKSGGVGIDLTRAHYCVLFSPTYSLGDYDQSLARLDRPGQVSHVQFYHLVAKDTVDEVVYDALDKKRSVVESVLEALRTRQKESETCEASS